MKKYMMFTLATLLLLTSLAMAFRSAHTALAADRVTLGEVQSYFQAWHNGRIAASMTGTGSSGQFQDPLTDAAILPFFSPIFSDLHYCAEDYHLIMLAWFGPDRNSLATFAAGLTQTFVVDGQALVTERTAIKSRYPTGFGFNEGAILAPGDLSVGAHMLEWYATFPDGSTDFDSFTFYIDATGTGACQ